MSVIGLIGGMSWESTAVYYKRLNEAVRTRLGGLHSAEILLHSLDFERVVRLQKAGDWAAAGRMLADAAAGLEAAGASCIAICTNTMHLVADDVAARVGIPVVNIIDETAAAVATGGCRRPLLLATRYTMEHGFYADRFRRRPGMELLVPDAAGRELVHRVIFEELCQGVVRPDSRTALLGVIARGIAAGADSVILGCTELCMILDPGGLAQPGFDSTAIHVEAALRLSGCGIDALARAA